MMAMRWYLSYSLSYREVEARLLERSVSVDYSTVQRWVERYAGELESAFRKRHKRYGPYIRWRRGETYVKLRGTWGYFYRAADKHGDILDFMFSETCTEKDAFRLLKKAIASHGLLEKITIDKSDASKAALIIFNG
jgi:transposase-like protein